MAMSDVNNSQNKKDYNPSVISRLKLKEASENNSGKELSFRMQSGLLNVIIQKYSTGESKYVELQKVCLSPMKARILSDEITKFRNRKDTFSTNQSVGVITGFGEERGIIYIHNAEGSNEENVQRVITIGIVDVNGNIKNAVDFMINANYHYAVEFEKDEISKFVAAYYNDIELDVFNDIISDFARFTNGVVGYSALDAGRFQIDQMTQNLNSCMEKLGIERRGSGNYRSAGNSFFDKNKGGAANSQYSNRARSNATTMEDMEQMIEDED